MIKSEQSNGTPATYTCRLSKITTVYVISVLKLIPSGNSVIHALSGLGTSEVYNKEYAFVSLIYQKAVNGCSVKECGII